MLLEELTDGLSFVRGEIVKDDVNLLPRGTQGYDLLQKSDELTAGMVRSGFAVDATGGGMADGHNVELLSLNSRGVRVPESVTDKILRYSVSLVSQGRHKFYTFTMPSDILAKTCFVSTRDADPQSGFQRLLDPARAQQIADYIDAGLGTIPSSIVLSAQPEAELRVIGGGKTIEFKSTKRSFLILDGQHRVWGFKLAKTALRVPVVVYNNLTRKDESRLFIDINTKQRPVPNELLLDIKKLAEYENTTEELSGKVFDLFNTETDSPLLGLLSSAERVKGKISRVTFYLCCLETSDSNICK